MADRALLILLHGFPMDSQIWAAQVAGLSDLVDVVAVDLRGFGTSPDAGPFTIDDLADDVHRLLAGRRCVLGGLSMGGYVALSVADRYPGDLRGLLLFDTKATADDATARAGRDAMIDLVRSQGASAVADQMVPKLLSPKASPEMIDSVRRMAASVPATTIEHALVAMRDRPDRTAMLGRIGVPTLAVVGADDAPTPPAVVDAMRRQIRGAERVVVPDAGHLSPLEQPAFVNPVMRSFLAGLAVGGH